MGSKRADSGLESAHEQLCDVPDEKKKGRRKGSQEDREEIKDTFTGIAMAMGML